MTENVTVPPEQQAAREELTALASAPYARGETIARFERLQELGRCAYPEAAGDELTAPRAPPAPPRDEPATLVLPELHGGFD